MFNGEKTKFGTRYYNFNNNVSSKKVEKFKEIYKRNTYREVKRNFQKWKEERNKKWAMLEVKKKKKERTVKMNDEQHGQQKNQQAESELEEAKEVKSLVQKRKKKRKRKKPLRTASYKKRKAKN